LNSSEASNIAKNFEDEGYDRIEFEEYPDVVVVNFCSATKNVVKSFG
jgi:threonylcarbamoyladenosine tRNA methylthiotransferase MtaB